MNTTEIAMILDEITATWPQKEVTGPEVKVWQQTLRPLSHHVASRAVGALRETQDWLPSHHQVLVAAQQAAKQINGARALASSRPARCELCLGSGWREIDGKPGYVTVDRCLCSKGRQLRAGAEGDHKSDCSCSRCHRGEAKSDF